MSEAKEVKLGIGTLFVGTLAAGSLILAAAVVGPVIALLGLVMIAPVLSFLMNRNFWVSSEALEVAPTPQIRTQIKSTGLTPRERSLAVQQSTFGFSKHA
jgi:hypothetical protein